MTTWGILLAAGNSTRLARATPKQYLSIANRLVIDYSLQALLATPAIAKLVVCLAADDAHWQHTNYSHDARLLVCTGGDSRAQSVRCGLSALSSVAMAEDWVVVHDAARPCLTTADLQLLFTELAEEQAGGVLVNPIFDTVKMGQSGYCLETADRSVLYRALTPQMFRYGHLCAALDAAAGRSATLSDEAMAMELAGHRVRLVVTTRADIKITNENDLRLAECLLGGRDDTDRSGL